MMVCAASAAGPFSSATCRASAIACTQQAAAVSDGRVHGIMDAFELSCRQPRTKACLVAE